MADATKAEFIVRTVILQCKFLPLLKINSSKRNFQAISISDVMIMVLMINLSARFTFLNPEKESKQKSDHRVTCSTLLNINYGRTAKFNLVILLSNSSIL